jgi:hypothetical protein
VRRQRDCERAQHLRTVEAGSDDALLDLGRDRLVVHRGGEGEEVDGIVGGHRNVLVRAFDRDVGHGERDEDRHVLLRLVEEAVADAHLLGRDREILGGHLDVFVAHENEPAGGKLGSGIVGERGDGGGRRDSKSDR